MYTSRSLQKILDWESHFFKGDSEFHNDSREEFHRQRLPTSPIPVQDGDYEVFAIWVEMPDGSLAFFPPWHPNIPKFIYDVDPITGKEDIYEPKALPAPAHVA